MFLIGAPGSGKSTAAQLLARDHGLEAFQSGQVLRAAARSARDPDLRRQVAERMRVSMPMPVEIYCRVLREYGWRRSSNGVVFDGYPRNVAQSESIPQVLEAAGLADGRVSGFVLHASSEVTLARSAKRLTCGRCGSETGEEQACCPGAHNVRRTDDSTDRFLSRSSHFHELLPAVRDHFSARWSCYDIDADQDSGQVVASITSRLDVTAQRPGGRGPR